MTTETARGGIERLLRPRSVAVVGISKEPGSLGETQVRNFVRFGFGGALHLVSRNRDEVEGHPCVRDVADLPHGIDAAVLCVPRAGVVPALEALAERGVGAAMVFASGFAEQDDAGRADQARIVEIATRSGMLVNGPNCLGLTNYVDGVPYAFGLTEPVHLDPSRPAVAVVTQSGATMVNVARGLQSRGLPIAFQASTGNEAVLGIEEHLAFVLEDDRRGPIALFAEQIRKPERFLELARRARERARPLVLLHPGRSEAARAAARTHTGALAGDHDVMRAIVEAAGVLVVDDLDLLVDVTMLLARRPPPRGGVAITTDSGAVKNLAIDTCADLGLPLAPLEPATVEAIHAALPAFAHAENPIDLTAQCIWDGLLYERTGGALLRDPNVGSLLVVPQNGPNMRWLRENRLFDEIDASPKPALLALPLATSIWPDDLAAQMAARGIAFTTTATLALRALGALTAYGERLARLEAPAQALPELARDARLPAGPLAEYEVKAVLRHAGIAVPDGALARSASDAVALARELGTPVALKAQAATLLHKTDAGGIVLDVRSPADVAAAWDRIHDAVRRARPDVTLDGILVEAMSAAGVELIVGVRRDPTWGLVLAIGLGGIFTEVLRDVALFAPDASRDTIVTRLRGLRGAALLAGARGAAAIDLDAVAEAARRLVALVRADATIAEFEINPLAAHPDGVVALDAAVVRA